MILGVKFSWNTLGYIRQEATILSRKRVWDVVFNTREVSRVPYQRVP